MDLMENARRRLAEGGFVVITNLPPGVQLGVDCQTYEVGHKFRGLKMIPPGIHLLHHYRLGGAEEIQGLWFQSHPGSVLALEWDTFAEDIGSAKLTPESYDNLCGSVARMELDEFLAPYPEEQHDTWRYLTSMISKEVLKKCGMPLGNKILPGDDPVERRDVVEQQQQEEEEDTVKGSHNNSHARPSLSGSIVRSSPSVAQVPRFIPLCKPLRGVEEVKELLPDERTRQNMDRSHQLQYIIMERFFGDWKMLLGELQLRVFFTLYSSLVKAAFISFIFLSSPMGLRHWQQLTVLLCSCDAATHESPEVFVAYLKALRSQLKQIPGDFFTSDLTRNNFLHEPLGALFETLLGSSTISPDLSAAARKLLRFVQEKFLILKNAGPAVRLQGSREVIAAEDWSLMVGTGEEGPAVVPYDEVVHVMGSDSEKSHRVPSDAINVEEHQKGPENRHSIPPPDASRVDAAWARMDASLGIQTTPSRIGSQPLKGDDDDNNSSSGRSLFAFTYPNLFASMENGEDILMSAVRLMDGGGEYAVAGSIAQQEAKMFIEREAGNSSGPLWGELLLLGTHSKQEDTC